MSNLIKKYGFIILPIGVMVLIVIFVTILYFIFHIQTICGLPLFVVGIVALSGVGFGWALGMLMLGRNKNEK